MSICLRIHPQFVVISSLSHEHVTAVVLSGEFFKIKQSEVFLCYRNLMQQPQNVQNSKNVQATIVSAEKSVELRISVKTILIL